MKTSKILMGLIFALFYINSAHACGKAIAKKCPLVKETTAYIDFKIPVTSDVDVGKHYKDYIAKIKGLEKTGNFKNFKIVTQSADITPGYNSNQITSATLRVTIEFDLNYDAVSNLYNNFKKSIINVSTFEVRRCLD